MEDEILIRLFNERSEEAISETELKYGRYCRKIANGILGDKGDVEECLNDTFLTVWNSIPPVVPLIFRAYIAKVTRNLALKMYEKRKAKKRDHDLVTQSLEELAECIPSRDNTAARIEHKEVIAALNEFLGTLDEKKCILFMQRYFYMKPIKEIAENNGISAGSLKTMLCRVRADLKEYIKEKGLY